MLGVWAVTILIAAYLGDMFALRSTSFQTVTPTQLANAMKQDDFYATYRENTVIFSGTVTSVSSNGSETNVGIKTASSYSLTCDLANGSNQSHKVGDTRKFAAEAYRANREPAGVLLKGCVVL